MSETTHLKLLIEALVAEELSEVGMDEGVLDAKTTELSRKIVQIVVNRYFGPKVKTSGPTKGKNIEFSADLPGIDRPVDIVAKVVTMDRLTRLRSNGAYYQTSRFKTPEGEALAKQMGVELKHDKLFLRIEIPKDYSQLSKTQLEQFVIDLKSTIAHELEHSRQRVRGDKTAYGEPLSTKFGAPPMSAREVFSSSYGAFKYFCSNAEIEAHVMQLYKIAKIKKISFEQSVDNYLGGKIFDSFSMRLGQASAKNIIAMIKEKWMAYAKARLPSAFKAVQEPAGSPEKVPGA